MMSEVKFQFEKVNSIKDNLIFKNNLGVIVGVNGDCVKVVQLFSQVNGVSGFGKGNEVNYNKGIVVI